MFYFLCVVTVVLLTVKQAMLHQSLLTKNKDDNAFTIQCEYLLSFGFLAFLESSKSDFVICYELD